jgi:molecular chaperone DnaK
MRASRQTAVFQVEDALKSTGDKIDQNEKASVEADLQAVKDIIAKYPDASQPMSDADLDALKAAKEKLMNGAQNLFSEMYKNMQQNQQGGPQAGPGSNASQEASGGNDADVVDADYKEV